MPYDTACVYELGPRQPKQMRILVMRHWPRGIPAEAIDLWVPDAAPSEALLTAYHAGMAWDEFRARYLAEQGEHRPGIVVREYGPLVERDNRGRPMPLGISTPVTPVQYLARLASYPIYCDSSLLLCCTERPLHHCHRYLLAGILA